MSVRHQLVNIYVEAKLTFSSFQFVMIASIFYYLAIASPISTRQCSSEGLKGLTDNSYASPSLND
eukprot:scaffold33273_cov55-Prasinocladus_malaysianus.AAC.1